MFQAHNVIGATRGRRLRAAIGRLSALCLFGAAPGLPRAAALQSTAADCYVSPQGDDGNPGTEAKPFKTLARVRAAVRALKQNHSRDILVLLRGGTYELADTWKLNALDSGPEKHTVHYRAYPGEKPVISGGRKVTAWRTDAQGHWTADVGNAEFRQLYVNGVRAARTRSTPPADLTPTGDLSAATAEAGYTTTDAAIAQWRNPADIEFGYFNSWSHMICKVQSINPQANGAKILMQQPGFYLASHKDGVKATMPDYIENAYELLKTPGQWYLDRAQHTLTYLPKEGETPTTTEVIMPILETLLDVRGTMDKPVHDISFEGLSFAYATWLRPSRVGHIDVQANFNIDNRDIYARQGTLLNTHNEYVRSQANVVLDAACSVRFDRCTFMNLGSAALDVQRGSQNNLINGCRFYAISGSAIQVGDVTRQDHHPDDPRRIVKGNRVVNNYIHDVGVDYEDSVGIFAGYTNGTTIAHNEIAALPYTGISVGWGWGEEDAGGGAYDQPFFFNTPTVAGDNHIEFNHIHDVMRTRNDGGGIYTLSNQPGTLIRGNHIHDNKGGPGGIYLDEGSGFIEVTGNSVYNVNRAMNYNNRAQNRQQTTKEHDNFFDLKPGDTGLPQSVLESAGLETGYKELLDRK